MSPMPASGRGQYRGGHRQERRDDDDPKWAICVHCGKFFPFDGRCRCTLAKEPIKQAAEMERHADEELFDPPKEAQ